MFLPDRYIKGECPNCGAKDQYGDNCDVCGAVYAPTDLKNPYSALSGAAPVLKSSAHHFFQLSAARCIEYLQQWTAAPGRLQPEVLNKIREWFSADDEGHVTLADWDISRDAPYFGIRIPDTEDKYFYVWLDAPVGYLASLKNHFGKTGGDFDAYMADPAVEQIHFIGKDISYFHTLFWPAMLHFAGRKTPDKIYVHGFITLGGDKMSKSRGHRAVAPALPGSRADPEWLRYYIAAKLNAKVEDIEFNPEDFVRAGQQRPDRQVQSTSPAAPRASWPSASTASCRRTSASRGVPCSMACAPPAAACAGCTRSASSARPCAKRCCWRTASTNTSIGTSPGTWPSRLAGGRAA
jgi:methionyl-tRNA synthetase